MGREFADDAVVVRVNDSTVLVQTLDFFTPVVDDPYHYGRIAAANSLSDVYAMGGRPLTAMNVCCFPTRTLGPEVLADVLRGGLDTLKAAGVMLAGGHTVEDKEPKYGMAVTGLVDPDRLITKAGARPGDTLILTKPLGTGVLTTAHKRGTVAAEHLEAAIEWMERLNDRASQVMVEAGVRGGTDVTGYGLLGHLYEMCRASQVTARILSDRVPLLEGTLDYAQEGCIPGGTMGNRSWLEGLDAVTWEVPELVRDVLCDAQTSGGLLVATPTPERVLAGLDHAWVVGEVTEKGERALVVT